MDDVASNGWRLGGGGARVLVGSCVPGNERGSLYGTCRNVRCEVEGWLLCCPSGGSRTYLRASHLFI